MTEPRRLRESGSPRARALIQAGKREAPSRDTEKVVLAGLGLGGASGPASGTASLKSEIARSASTKSLASLKPLALSKVGVGVLAAAMAGSAGYVTGRHDERAIERTNAATASPLGASRTPATSALAAPLSPPPATEEAPAPSPAEAIVPRAPSQTVATVPRAPSELVATAPNASPTADPSPVSTHDAAHDAAHDSPLHVAESPLSSIAEQLASIRVARTCVQNRDGKGALAALDAYAARNPHGTFEEEEMALRVRALRLLGDLAGAARARANLQSRFPGSVHVSTLE
jgi:hypothetical protein